MCMHVCKINIKSCLLIKVLIYSKKVVGFFHWKTYHWCAEKSISRVLRQLQKKAQRIHLVGAFKFHKLQLLFLLNKGSQ